MKQFTYILYLTTTKKPFLICSQSQHRLYEYTFIKMLQAVANLLTDIVPTSGIPRINQVIWSILIDL